MQPTGELVTSQLSNVTTSCRIQLFNPLRRTADCRCEPRSGAGYSHRGCTNPFRQATHPFANREVGLLGARAQPRRRVSSAGPLPSLRMRSLMSSPGAWLRIAVCMVLMSRSVVTS